MIRNFILPCELPRKTYIEAIYLNRQLPSNSNVTDETWNGNNASLVQSNCGKWDGATKAIGTADSIHNGSYLKIEMFAKFTDIGGVVSKRGYVADGELEFYIRVIDATTIKVGISENGTDYEEVSFTVLDLFDGNWHTFSVIIDSGDVTLTLDSNTQTDSFATYTTIYNGAGVLTIGSIGSYVPIKASFANVNINNGLCVFNLAEGGLSDTLYNTGSVGGNATLDGATLTDFWSETQDVWHYNFLDGFDLWENGTAGQEIRVPIGATVTTSGYSKTGTYEAGKWHNNAETKIQLPATLKAVADGDITDPLGYSDFETNFNDAWVAFSKLRAGEHKYLVFYNTALTTLTDKKKIQKCLDVKNSEYVLTDASGNVLTDDDGLILTGE